MRPSTIERKRCRGSVLTELAVTAPVYILMIAGLLCLARIGVLKQRTAMAARYAAWTARRGAIGQLPSDHAGLQVRRIQPLRQEGVISEMLPDIAARQEGSTLLELLGRAADGLNNTVGAEAHVRLDLPAPLAGATGHVDLTTACFVDDSTWTFSDAMDFATDFFSLEDEAGYPGGAMNSPGRSQAASPVALDLRAGEARVRVFPDNARPTPAGSPLPGNTLLEVLGSSHSAPYSMTVHDGVRTDAPASHAALRPPAGRLVCRVRMPEGEGEVALFQDGPRLTMIAADREPGEQSSTVIEITTTVNGGHWQ